MKKIKLNHLEIGGKEIQNIKRVILSGHLERSVKTENVENQIQKMFSVKHAILTSSGTSALIAGLKACDIGEGDEVISTPYTFVATINAIYLVGAKPVFVDINEHDYNIDTAKIEQKITKKTKAILTVDLYGQTCEYDKLTKLAKKYNLKIIADSCQALGAKYKGEYMFPGVSIQIFSFFGNKIITSGEGGLAITNDSKIAKNFSLLISHGKERGLGLDFTKVGWNFRPTDIQAAILENQLSKIPQFINKRKLNAKLLTSKLNKIKGIITPEITNGNDHSFFRYTIRITKKFPISREKLIEYLKLKNIDTEVSYPKPLHLYKKLPYYMKSGSFPNAERISKEVLTLPIHQKLTTAEIDYIYRCILRSTKDE